MQGKTNLECPWCFYEFSETARLSIKPATNTQFTCPRCSRFFKVARGANHLFYTSNNCNDNGVRHNWKYRHVEGYDVYKKCRRCGKEDIRPTQIKLPGFTTATT